MASIIKLKRSTSSGTVPSGGALQAGELAINLADKKLFSSTDGTDIITISGDQYNLATLGNTSHEFTAADLRLTVDNDALSNDLISLIGTDNISVTRNSNGSITFDTTASMTLADVDVIGDLYVTGTARVDTLTIDENTTANGTLTVVGLTTVADITSTGTATLATVDINGGAIDGTAIGSSSTSTGAFTTLDASGLASLDGGIDVNGSNFTVATTGAIDTASSLTVDGASALNQVTATTIQANSTLDVGGLASLDGGIDVDGAFTVADSTGDVSTTGDLNVDGDSTLNGTTVTTFTANGAATFASAVTISDTTGSTSASTGSLIVGGGAGIAEKLYVGDDIDISGDAVIDGNLTVQGALTYISTSTVYADDGMFKLAANNAGDTVDTGIYAAIYHSGNTSYTYSGYFRDATNGVFKFYNSLDVEPTQTVDTTDTGYTLAQVDAIIDGGSF